jgi:hypothetical protein
VVQPAAVVVADMFPEEDTEDGGCQPEVAVVGHLVAEAEEVGPVVAVALGDLAAVVAAEVGQAVVGKFLCFTRKSKL